MIGRGYQRTRTTAAAHSARRTRQAFAGTAERWPRDDDADDAEISRQLAAISQFYRNVAPEPAERSAASGLAVVARSDPGHVRDAYLTPWSAGDVRHKLMAVSVLSVMADDQLLGLAALDIAVGWARNGGQEREATAAVAFGGRMGQRHPGVAMRCLWALTMRGERVSQVANLAFAQLFAAEASATEACAAEASATEADAAQTNADASAAAMFLVYKLRRLSKLEAGACEREAALTVVNAVLSAEQAGSSTPAVAGLLRTRPGNLQPVAELWAAALNSVPHRRAAVVALHLTLAALAEDTASRELAADLGRAILPGLAARTREVLELTLPDPRRTETISASLMSAFLGTEREVVRALR